MGGSKPGSPKAKAAQASVSYRKEGVREVAGGRKRTVGAQYMSSRSKTPQGSGFGGQKTTLG